MATLTVVKSEQLMPGSCFLVATSSAPPCILQQQQAPSNTSATAATAATRLAPKRTRLHAEISNEHDSDLLRCKRRIQFGQIHQQQPAAVARRNERERNRVRLVNLGFATLRQHVPQSAKNKKMSKVDTLRSAVEYIKQLQQLLNEQDSSPTGSSDENTYLGHSYASSMASTATTSVTSPAYSGASSPTPSVCSDSSSPYDILNGDDDELIDLATWL